MKVSFSVQGSCNSARYGLPVHQKPVSSDRALAPPSYIMASRYILTKGFLSGVEQSLIMLISVIVFVASAFFGTISCEIIETPYEIDWSLNELQQDDIELVNIIRTKYLIPPSDLPYNFTHGEC